MADRERCVCHDEPMYWERDKRMVAGGYWRCAVRRREKSLRVDRARREIKAARQRERYDNDPIHRIEKRLRDDARRRKQRLERRRADFATEHGGF